MHRRIYAYGAAALLRRTHNDAARAGNESFAGRDRGIAAGKVVGIGGCEVVLRQIVFDGVFAAIEFRPLARCNQLVELRYQFGIIGAKGETSLQLGKVLGKLYFYLLL